MLGRHALQKAHVVLRMELCQFAGRGLARRLRARAGGLEHTRATGTLLACVHSALHKLAGHSHARQRRVRGPVSLGDVRN